MTGQENEEQRSNRSARIRLSLVQDIVYSVTEGKVKTPKSVLLPTVVKQLTDNTEIINTLNKLGHGVSYSILSDMHTENALHHSISATSRRHLATELSKRKLHCIRCK